ncbi:MAG TPA: hypothetical protein VF545_00470 [Thermoleophilaceae bacterium]|jgi:hypothetical protein
MRGSALERRLRSEHGFVSLAEMIWVCLLLVLVLGVALAPFDIWHSTERRTRSQADSQDNARVTLDSVAHELRNIAGQTQLVERATSYDLVFQTVDSGPKPSGSQNSRNIMRVRYCLDTTDPARGMLWEQTLKWTTAAVPSSMPSATSCPDSSWTSAQRTVLTDAITNRISGQDRPLFSFFPTGATLATITSVRVDLYTDRDPSDAVKEARLTSGVLLRNQSGAPTATATSTATGVSKQVKLDAGASADPENLPLSYMWCDVTSTAVCDSTTDLGTDSPFTYTFTAATGSVRNMRLIVTDLGGLQGTYNFNVTVP